MKVPILFFILFSLSCSTLITIPTDCPTQYVPNPSRICIRPTYIPGCDTYLSPTQCASCNQDYQLSQGRCSPSDSSASVSLLGCLSPAPCTNCANGYILSNGTCLPGVQFCLQYTSSNECSRCESDYSLIFGECRHNLMLGCQQQQSDHSCVECYKPFTLQNYQCVVADCKSYNDYGCYACECGYYVTELRTCQKMVDGCIKYYRGGCMECLPHYKLKGGLCGIEGCMEMVDGQCTICQQKYDLVEGTCQFKNCLDWIDDACLICKQGYNLIGGKCVSSKGKYVCSE